MNRNPSRSVMTPESFELMRQHCEFLIAEHRAGKSVPAEGLEWARRLLAANPVAKAAVPADEETRE